MDGNDVYLGRKISAVIVGYGNRGQVYGDYSLTCPDELEIKAVVDPNEFKLEMAKERYHLSKDVLFKSFSEFVASGQKCDLVINTTMDQLHYQTAMEILDAGFDMLIEKPVVPTKSQLLAIRDKAGEKNCKVFVCHVLRYTPFYSGIKEIINSGEIGTIVSMEMNEHVGNSHYLTSYVRGKWNSEKNCGSGLLLAKCCHDMDLMCWLNNATSPYKVTSFGSRSHFIRENKPKGATEYCYQCKNERTCPHSAIRQYIEMDVMPFLVWDKLNKPLDEITIDEKMEFLKKDTYGKCAYDIPETDLVDRQQVCVEFKNGSVCNFTLSAGTAKADRYIHIVGTRGEIEGKVGDNKFVVRDLTLGKITEDERIVDVKDKVILKSRFGGHYGGDFNIMHDLISFLNGNSNSVSLTSLSDSINGHLCIYAAEKSRKQGAITLIET